MYSLEYIKALEERPRIADLNITFEGDQGNSTIDKRQWTSGWSCNIWAGWGEHEYSLSDISIDLGNLC